MFTVNKSGIYESGSISYFYRKYVFIGDCLYSMCVLCGYPNEKEGVRWL